MTLPVRLEIDTADTVEAVGRLVERLRHTDQVRPTAELIRLRAHVVRKLGDARLRLLNASGPAREKWLTRVAGWEASLRDVEELADEL